MDRAASVLTQIDLVGIRLQDLVLAVSPLQQEGHVSLLELAFEGTIGVQIKILDQLLGQGAGALDHRSSLKVAVGGAQDAFRIHAEVMLEIPVLDRHQGFDQEVGEILAAHQHPVFVMSGIDAGDEHGIEPDQRRIGTAIGILQGGNPLIGDLDIEMAGGFLAVPKTEGTSLHQKMVAFAPIGS